MTAIRNWAVAIGDEHPNHPEWRRVPDRHNWVFEREDGARVSVSWSTAALGADVDSQIAYLIQLQGQRDRRFLFRLAEIEAKAQRQQGRAPLGVSAATYVDDISWLLRELRKARGIPEPPTPVESKDTGTTTTNEAL